MKGKEVFLHDTNEKDLEWEEKGLRGAARNDRSVMVRKRNDRDEAWRLCVWRCIENLMDVAKSLALEVLEVRNSWPRDIPSKTIKLYCSSKTRYVYMVPKKIIVRVCKRDPGQKSERRLTMVRDLVSFDSKCNIHPRIPTPLTRSTL